VIYRATGVRRLRAVTHGCRKELTQLFSFKSAECVLSLVFKQILNSPVRGKTAADQIESIVAFIKYPKTRY
jgi:hypothetical protein